MRSGAAAERPQTGPPTRNLRARTGPSPGPPSAPLRRSRRSGASSSSSCAQTPDEHSTTTVPAVSARGCASAATVGPDGLVPDRPGRAPGASAGARRRPTPRARRASERWAGAASRGAATAGWSAPALDLDHRVARVAGVGHVRRARSWSAGSGRPRAAGRPAAPRRDASSSDITSSSSISGVVPRWSRSTSRSANRSARSATRCWPWEPYWRSAAAAVHQAEVVAMRSVGGEAALEVGRRGARPAPPPGPPASAAADRGRYSRADGLGQAEQGPQLREPRRQQGHRLAPVGHQLDPVAGQLGVPGVQGGRAAGPGADPAEQRVALAQRARVRGPRLGAARARPRPRTGPGGRGAGAGAPLTSSSRSGRKTLASGRAGDADRLSTGASSTRIGLRLARREADLDACARSRPRSTVVRGHARHGRARAGPARARWWSAATGPGSRSRPPRGGSSCPRRSGRRRSSGPGRARPRARS